MDNNNKPGTDLKERYRRPYILERRKIRQAARRVARANRVALIVALAIILAILMLLISFCSERTGNFTINMNRLELYRKGLSLSDTSEFENPTSRLSAKKSVSATDIATDDVISEIELAHLLETEGEASSDDYVAYTFFVKNGGLVPMDFYVNIMLEKASRGLQDCIRVLLYKNGVFYDNYAKRSANGQPEEGTTPWLSDSVIMEEKVNQFPVGQVIRYTVIIYIEGSDPECKDDRIGGMVRCSMNFDEVSALEKSGISSTEAAESTAPVGS